ncbi:PAS domain-containing protein [uncultured Jannaschia sp.]|uniref:PAS domain-containing protein n=1 Tax=uncultured Jannaschia sp. TaxID=293347 RepID=UPI0026294B7F|nr:PAS domain-containing protein [uncultured Jannaschia sp.]
MPEDKIDQLDRAINPDEIGYNPSANLSDMAEDVDHLFRQAVEQTRMSICIADARQDDLPIVLCNQAFVEQTGYPREEVIGRNCRFLQGPDTDRGTVDLIRDAIERREVRVVEILNYRRDGTPFWNSLHIGPIFSPEGQLTHVFGSQWDVTEMLDERDRSRRSEDIAEELLHRTRNLFAVTTAILRISAKGARDIPDLVASVSDRLSALARAQEASISSVDGGTDLAVMLDAIIRPYRTDSATHITLGGPEVMLRREQVAPLGMALHELSTNAAKYGAFRSHAGRVSVEWTRQDDMLELRWIERGVPDDATVQADPKAGGGTGTNLVQRILAANGGRIETDLHADGIDVVVRMPL